MHLSVVSSIWLPVNLIIYSSFRREILQPTIFDPTAFHVWAEEAFSLWTSMWLSLYDFDTESFELIETIRDAYYLVAIIDNNYLSRTNPEEGSLFKAMFKVGAEAIS